jgi:hypothetical protein
VVKLKAPVNSGDTFRETALEWFDKHHARWSGHYATREKRNLEKDLFPYFDVRRFALALQTASPNPGQQVSAMMQARR